MYTFQKLFTLLPASIFASGPESDPALFTTLPKDPVPQPPNELAAFLTDLFPGNSVSTHVSSEGQTAILTTSDRDTDSSQAAVNSATHGCTTIASNLMTGSTHSRRSASCPAAHQPTLIAGVKSKAIGTAVDRLNHCPPVGDNDKVDEGKLLIPVISD